MFKAGLITATDLMPYLTPCPEQTSFYRLLNPIASGYSLLAVDWLTRPSPGHLCIYTDGLDVDVAAYELATRYAARGMYPVGVVSSTIIPHW